MASKRPAVPAEPVADQRPIEITVRRMHRRDVNRAWEFVKFCFRDVNRETVEYQRPLSKRRFAEVYDDDSIEQLLFEVDGDIVGYAECTFDPRGDDSWINPRYFEKRDMRPLFVEELASHPDYRGRGVGNFMLEQLQHFGRVRGCTHLVLEVAENNELALKWYRKRGFYKLDAAIFLAQRVPTEPELLPPRTLGGRRGSRTNAPGTSPVKGPAGTRAKAPAGSAAKARVGTRATAPAGTPRKPPAKR